jgi:dynein heavy chain 1
MPETVKTLVDQLGSFVLVFDCHESFDFKALDRIFVGLCQVGAWGCFDKINTGEEDSQQIQTMLDNGTQAGGRGFTHPLLPAE